MNTFQILTNISVFSPIPAILLFLYFRNTQFKTTNLIFVILVVSIVADLTSKYFIHSGRSNYIVLNVYFPISLITTIILYYHLYFEKRIFPIMIVCGGAILAIAFLLLGQSFAAGQNINWVLCTVLVEVMTIGHFRYLSNNPVYDIKSYGPFWISMAFFSYSSISFIIFGLENYLKGLPDQEFILYSWMAHNVMNVFKNICLGIAIWWTIKRNRSYNDVNSVNPQAVSHTE